MDEPNLKSWQWEKLSAGSGSSGGAAPASRAAVPLGPNQGRTATRDEIFDYQRSLGRLGGDAGLFAEIAALFLEDSPQLIALARTSLAAGNGAELERAAHSLQGLSANFSALAMASAANMVEQHARKRDLQGAAACFPVMEAELLRLQRALAPFRRPEEPIVDEQHQVTEDIARVQRLTDLKAAGVLSAEEGQFVSELALHRIGSVMGSEIIAAENSPSPPVRSCRIVLTSEQRARADAVLMAHGG